MRASRGAGAAELVAVEPFSGGQRRRRRRLRASRRRWTLCSVMCSQPSDAHDVPLTLGVAGAVTAAKTGEASSLAAAQAVAREHGVACDEAVLIAAGSNVLVHLKPAPVVARVMTGTAVLHDDVEQWLAREVAVGAFLAERTDLVVAPSDILPPGPHKQDGLWMTLWKFVAHDAQAPPPEPRELGRSLRELHAALADFPGDLAPLSEIRDWLERLLAELRPSLALTQQDIDWLRLQAGRTDPSGLRELIARSGSSWRCLDVESAADRERAGLERSRGRLRGPRRVGHLRARDERRRSRAERDVHRRATRCLR